MPVPYKRNIGWMPVIRSEDDLLFHYEQPIDPMLDSDPRVYENVRAGQWWFDTATNILKRRDPQNADWSPVVQGDAGGGLLFHYEQASDPGAVGAGKWWYDTTNNLLKRRNSQNAGWITLAGGGGGSSLPVTLISDNDNAPVIDADGEQVGVPFTGAVSILHNLLTGNQLHSPWDFEQTSDPGEVGAGKWWYDETNNLIKRRNDADDGWDSITVPE